MTKTIAVGVAVVMLLVAAGLVGAEAAPQGPGGAAGQPRMGPQGGPMGPWLDELDKAYQQKDMDKIGALIAQMKERRSQFRGRPGEMGPGGPPERMRGSGGGRFGPPGQEQSSLSKPPVPKSAAEKKILAVLNEMNENQRRGMMNVPPEGGRVLRLLAEAIGAKNIVEIGTSNGYSGIWQCLALRATGGKLTTFEIDARRAALARENFQRAGVENLVTLVEGDAHEKVAQVQGPVDMVFVDADKEGYTDYLQKLLPKVRPGGLIVAHNINPGMANPPYVEAITTNPGLDTVFLNQGGGISVTMKKHSSE